MRKLLAALILVSLVSVAGATTIGSESTVIDLEDSSVKVQIKVDELTTQQFTYITSYEISNVQADSGGEILECSVNNLPVGSEILCEPPAENNFTVELSFQGDGLVSHQGETRIFRYSQSIYRPTNNYSLQVILPQGAGLLEEGNLSTPVVSPESGQVSSNGRRIFVTWKQNPQLGENVRFQVVYERFSNGVNYLYYGFIAAGVLILLLIVYLFYRRWNRESIESVYGELSEDEIEVIEILRGNDGTMLQKDIVNETLYSKAKISGIVSSLVENDIITKEKEGRSNKLSISRQYYS